MKDSATLDPGRIIATVTSGFKNFLESEWKLVKTPYGFRKAFAQACSAPQDCTERIFLDSGFHVFLAYHLANNTQGRQYKDKSTYQAAIAAFRQLPIDQQRKAADQLAQIQVHSTVASAIERISTRLLLPESPSLNEMQNISAANPQTFLNTTLDGTAVPQDRSDRSIEVPDSPTTPSESVEQQIVSDPPIERLVEVFPPYTCGAIRKTGDRASITMTFPFFPAGGKIVCLMSLTILQNKVEYLARELFGVHIETENGIRYMVLESGGRVIPGQELVLQGAGDEAIARLLGPEMSCAIKASPARKEEEKHAIFATRCVTMRLSRDPNHEAILNLNLGLEESFRLKEKLYR